MQALKRKRGRRAEGTCDWILGTTELTAWLGDAPESVSPPADVFWLHGNPGTGKSTMSMFLAEALSEAFSKSPTKTLAYFFCDAGYDARRTATAIVRGLLLQLVQQHPRLIEHVLPKYEERKARVFESFDAVWSMFLRACSDTATGRKHCIVDALDECTEHEQMTLLKQIEETFGPDRSGRGSLNVSLLITSRPYPEIGEYLDAFPNEDLASFEESRQDIYKFIDEKVADLKRRKKYTDSVAAKVARLLRGKAGGIFLWVGLACQELENVASKDAVACLDTIPAGLQSLYEKLLSATFETEDASVIKRLLGFVMVARKPPTIWELPSACELYEEHGFEERIQFTKEVIAACRLMIVVHNELVSLLHHSVRNFLLDGAGSRGFTSEQEVHGQLARRCVDSVITDFRRNGGEINRHGDPFLLYAVHFWPEHVRMAGEHFRIEDDQAEFFARDSRILYEWWTQHMYMWPRPDASVSILHVAAHWGIPYFADYALSLSGNRAAGGDLAAAHPLGIFNLHWAMAHWGTPLLVGFFALLSGYGTTTYFVPFLPPQSRPVGVAVFWGIPSLIGFGLFLSVVAYRARGSTLQTRRYCYVDAAYKSSADMTPLAYSAKSGHVDIFRLLLEHENPAAQLEEVVISAVVKNARCNIALLECLLSFRREQPITPIVKAAAENSENGADVIEFLFARRGEQITITEDIVQAAARNSRASGAKIMELLLERRGDEITITEDIVHEAVRNWDIKIMELLLERRGDEITVTEDIIKTAVNWENGADMIELLLERKGDQQFTITEDIVRAAVLKSKDGAKTMELLLERRGDQFTITEDIVRNSVSNWVSGAKIMELLLERRGDQFTITEDIVREAVRNWESGAKIVELLLERRGNQFTITEDIVRDAVRNVISGTREIVLLLKRRGDQLTITEDIVRDAVRNFMSGAKIMELLLGRRGDQFTITEDIVKAAARTPYNVAGTLELLFERRGHEIMVTEDIVKAAAGNDEGGIRAIEVLLKWRGDQITVTEDILRIARENQRREAILELFERWRR